MNSLSIFSLRNNSSAICFSRGRIMLFLRPSSSLSPSILRRTMSRTMSSLSPEKSRIYVLGLGSIGTFAAHSLREIPHQPLVTLLLHRELLLDVYHQTGHQILLDTPEGTQIGHGGFDLEILREGRWNPVSLSGSSLTAGGALELNKDSDDLTVNNLIVSVKATQTVPALRPLRNRLSATSTIRFLQNGCGMIDDVNDALFSEPRSRPSYIIGVVSRGITSNRSFHVHHRGPAAMSLGPVPRHHETTSFGEDMDCHTSSQGCDHFLHSLPQAPRLNAKAYTFIDVFQFQLGKLAVNAFCNPLCALNNANNGFLFTLPETRRKILTEISAVVLALPELQNIPGVRERFVVERL